MKPLPMKQRLSAGRDKLKSLAKVLCTMMFAVFKGYARPGPSVPQWLFRGPQLLDMTARVTAAPASPDQLA